MAIIIIIITILLIALILFILIKTVIHNNKMNLGILKAVGYTTRQLRLQTSWSLMPVVGIGVMIGAILSYLTMNNVIIILFRV
ncbi:FtsX-like permease family protein, partial [Anaerosporobacter sp.]|uniref:FtsX-like permease family protein n=1 Tax=Anaerosporobacter sp. TaxID=1872529 RepID=UPI0028982253